MKIIFAKGPYKGKTIQEVASDDDGRLYLDLIRGGELEVSAQCTQALNEYDSGGES